MAEDPKPDPVEDPKPDPADLGETGKKALDAERKARRDAEKKANDLEARLKDLEDKDKSEVERLTNRVGELEKSLGDANSRAMRMEVALDKGLTKTQARRLVGDNEDDLIADADDLLASFKPGDEKPTPAGGPKEKLRPGAAPSDTDEPTKDELRQKIGAIPR